MRRRRRKVRSGQSCRGPARTYKEFPHAPFSMRSGRSDFAFRAGSQMTCRHQHHLNIQIGVADVMIEIVMEHFLDGLLLLACNEYTRAAVYKPHVARQQSVYPPAVRIGDRARALGTQRQRSALSHGCCTTYIMGREYRSQFRAEFRRDRPALPEMLNGKFSNFVVIRQPDINDVKPSG